MFEGVQDQFHQFLAAAAAAAASSTPPPPIRTASSNSLPLPPLSFSLLHGSNSSSSPSSNSFPIFDAYLPPPPTHPHHHHPHILQPPLHHQFPPPHTKSVVKQEGELVLERERSMAPESIDPWSHDEVLALLRIRSAMENWFPEFTWERVSRKMEEMGFKRSSQKCKEKFEEESRYLHTNESCTTKSYRLFSELEELYHHGHDPPPPHHSTQNDVALDKQNPQVEEQEHEQEQEDDQEQLGGGEGQGERGDGQDKIGQERLLEENDCSEATDHHDQTIDRMDEDTRMERKKRRNHHQMSRKKKFEMFKRFCEEIVSKMMAQQEELHNRILEDINKRDEEKIAREEAWRKQEIDRINKEMEDRARDQAIAGDRQAKIIEFLKKFTSNSTNNNTIINNNEEDNDVCIKPSHNPISSNTPILSIRQNPSSSATQSCPNHIPTSSNDDSLSQTSNSLTTHIDPIARTSNPSPKNNKTQNSRKPRPNKRTYSDNCSDYNDTGKRWPREEVLALINIRCNVDQNSNAGSDDRGQNQNQNNGNNNTKNPPLWERISQRMLDLGYKRSAKRCKEKWENINKYFRKTKDMNKKRSVDSRTCPYFHQLNHLYSQGRTIGGAHGSAGGSTSSDIVLGGGGGATIAMDATDQGEDNVVQIIATSACDFEF